MRTTKMQIIVKTPKYSGIRRIAVIILKFKQGGFTVEECIQQMQMEWQTETA